MVITNKGGWTASQARHDIGRRDCWFATRSQERKPFSYLTLKDCSRLKPPLHHGHTNPEWHWPIMFTCLNLCVARTQQSTSTIWKDTVKHVDFTCGKRFHNHGKNPCSMEQLTFQWPFSIATVYCIPEGTRVKWFHLGWSGLGYPPFSGSFLFEGFFSTDHLQTRGETYHRVSPKLLYQQSPLDFFTISPYLSPI